METKHRRTLTVASVGCAVTALAAGVLGTPAHAMATTPPAFSVANVSHYGGEPSITSDSTGVLYESSPSNAGEVYKSTDKGATWHKTTGSPDSSSGDDCLATDQSNALYWCNLASTSSGQLPLQADVWKSVDGGANWAHGDGAVTGMCSTSCNPFGVDRQWTAASILSAGQTTSQAEVVLMYHDFYGPSHIWVNVSQNGGATFGAAQEVLSSPNVSAGALPGELTAQGYTFCNSVPAGVAIVPRDAPAAKHPGRIFVAWIASDPAQDLTGCNISMDQSFHTVWISYSDDKGVSWTPQLAFDGGVGHDASTPFAAFTIDNQGDPYIAFDMNHWDSNPATNLGLTAQCAGFSTAGTLQAHPECGYDQYVVWSQDGGSTWDGGGGTIPGSAGAPYKVNPDSETGTHFFPTIAAGDPGKVDVGYLRTTTLDPTDPFGKVDPGGCGGPNSTATMFYPPACSWNLYEAQSLNLTQSPGSATWVTSPITTIAMHQGDICNLGIACVGTVGSNRNLLDFNQETIDPTTGCAHISFADDNTVHQLRAANQISGPSAIGSGGCGLSANTPEAPWAALLVTASGAGVLVWQMRRRRRVTTLA
jgi:hypothetical protein